MCSKTPESLDSFVYLKKKILYWFSEVILVWSSYTGSHTKKNNPVPKYAYIGRKDFSSKYVCVMYIAGQLRRDVLLLLRVNASADTPSQVQYHELG